MKRFLSTFFFLALFWFVSILHLVSIMLNNDLLILISKPLILVSLSIYFLFETYSLRNQKKIKYVYGALLFSFGGDILLMFTSSGESYFISGLASFLIAQIFYIITYSKFRISNLSNKKGITLKVTLTILFFIYMIILWLQLYPGLGELVIPVSVYAITILLMVIFAIYRMGATSTLSYHLVLAGAIVFLISDSLIAINKFIIPIENENLIVMITYLAAQYLIIRGLIQHLKFEIS